MSDFRIKHGLALGPFGSVGITSANNTFPDGDTTPDISLGSYWLTANTAATTITYFDGRLVGGVAGIEEGKLVVINFRDNNTTVSNAGQIFLTETGATFRTNEILGLVHTNSSWYELFRANNNQSAEQEQGRYRHVTVGASASHGIDVTTANVVFWEPTAANSVLQSISGGELGQVITLVLNTASIASRISDQGNIIVGGSATITAEANVGYQFVYTGSTDTDTSTWTLISSRANANA